MIIWPLVHRPFLHVVFPRWLLEAHFLEGQRNHLNDSFRWFRWVWQFGAHVEPMWSPALADLWSLWVYAICRLSADLQTNDSLRVDANLDP